MTDIEQKALALLNKVLAERPFGPNDNYIYVTLCRAIEQHEAFRQEVSDAVEFAVQHPASVTRERLSRFIIAKPDPVRMLVEAFDVVWPGIDKAMVEALRAAIEKRGGKIVWREG